MSQPEKATNNIIIQINDAFQKHSDTNGLEFLLRKAQKEAENLKAAGEPADAYTILGLISCLKGDREECIRNHEIAIKLDRNSSFVLSNYSNSLCNIFEFDKAIEIASRLKNIDDEAYLRRMAMANFFIGNISLAAEYASEHINKSHAVDEAIKSAIDSYNLITAHNLSDLDFRKAMGMAAEVLSSNNVINNKDVEIYEGHEGEVILSYIIDDEPETVSNLEDQFIDKLVDGDFSESFIREVTCCFSQHIEQSEVVAA